MASSSSPFALPDTLERSLSRVLSYWEGLKRAANSMPFWDDLKLSAIAEQSDGLLLIDVFSNPERFRFNLVADEMTNRYGEHLAGKFIDEIELRDPFAYLRAQCSVTVEARMPTYYRKDVGELSPGAADYARLLLPMWGEGEIRLLLGAIDQR